MRWIFSIYLILPAGPEIDSASKRNDDQEVYWKKSRSARRADNLAAISEPNV
jgi:hypothetical protein